MPFLSEAQRRFMWAKHPDIARRWAHEYPNQGKLPMHAGGQPVNRTFAQLARERRHRKTRVRTIQPTKKGQKPISFHPGGLHQSLGVPAGTPIPDSKFSGALSGQYGPRAAAQARFAKNVLHR